MAWTFRGLMGLSFGLSCLFVAGCDDGGGDSNTTGGNTNTATTSSAALEGLPIAFNNGWAAGVDNDFNIQGAFYTFNDNADGGTSTIMPADFSAGGMQVCAQGSAGQVMPGDDGMPNYSDYWGAAIGLNLQQEENVDTALSYDATANGLTGFSFNVAGGDPIPAGGELRFNVKVSGDDHNYCKKISAAGVNTFKLTDLHQDCWLATAATLPTPDATKLEAIHWQYVTNATASYNFDICITALNGTNN